MAEIRYARVGDLHPSFRRDGSRCLRNGTSKRAPSVEMGPHTVQLVPPGSGRSGWQCAEVYRVQISPDLKARWPKQPESYRVIALSENAVVSYIKKRYGNIAARNMGLASYVLSLAMQKISTRAPAAGSIGARARKIGDSWVEVNVTDGNQNYTVRIKDNLTYSVDAVNGGEGGIESALQSAANRVNGMIRNKIGAGRFDEEWRTPFPEVKRK